MTESLKAKIESAKISAMRAKMAAETDEAKQEAELRLSVARALIGAVAEAETAGKQRRELDESQVTAVLQSEAKKRRGSAEIYASAGEDERATKEANEAAIIEEFLPKAPTELELQYFIADYVGANGLGGTGRASMGVVMKALKEEFSNFDGKVASTLAAKILA